ncbi:hypothetical protein [Herbaspirillum sp. ST 5-3]|uniref:hypothetical protein n=1 Tax=Oxalobacteraceae TaxID=75682 RepID=UPI0010A49571|nr:hypothetical protein [Herbaspirillum sp. ST 5-3]
MRASFILCAVVVLLTGCGTAQERAAYREDPVLAMSQEYGPPCVEHGFAQGSESWRQCIIRSSTRADLMQQGLYFDRYMQWYWLR